MPSSSTSSLPIRYRSIATRTIEDQMEAMERGFNSVLELAFDELQQAVVALYERVALLEGGGAIAQVDPED